MGKVGQEYFVDEVQSKYKANHPNKKSFSQLLSTWSDGLAPQLF